MRQMSMAKGFHRYALVLIAMAAVGLSAPALAQEPSAEHLAAARGAIDAIGATNQFDAILPNAARNLKQYSFKPHPICRMPFR